MMAYDKQLKELYNDVRRGSNPLGGYEDPPPLGYINMNPVCILGHQINEQRAGLMDDMSMSIGTQKRFHICRMIEICHNANVDRNNG